MDIKIKNINGQGTEKEKIVLYVQKMCNLGQYILFDITKDENGFNSNKLRHMFILPNKIVNAGDYVYVYTHKGQDKSYNNKAKTLTYEIYWGLDVNIWNEDGDNVILVHYDDSDMLKI